MLENLCKGNNLLLTNKAFHAITGLKRFKILCSAINDDNVTATIECSSPRAQCPVCGRYSSSIHSHYSRKLISMPIYGKPFNFYFHARRFRCNNPECHRKTFSEQPAELTWRYGRRSKETDVMLQSLLIEVSARKGSYQSKLIGVPISPSTALRIVKSAPLEKIDPTSITHLCIDDFAYRKGMTYGTIVINADTGKFLELVDSRDADPVSEALKKYTSVQTITRDRSNAFSKAIRSSLPESLQIADKFHLMKNASDHIDHQLRQSFREIKKEAQGSLEDDAMSAREGEPTEMRKERFRRVHELRKKGLSIQEIERQLHSDKKTILYYLSLEEAPGKKRWTKVDYYGHMPTIKEGIANNLAGAAIYKKCVAEGLNVSEVCFRKWLTKTFPEYKTPQGSKKRGETVDNSQAVKSDRSLDMLYNKRLSIYVTKPDWGVNKKTGDCSDEHILMNEMISKSPTMLSLREVYVSFKNVLAGSSPDLLDEWISKYESSRFSYVNSFVRGIQFDIDAIKNAIRYPQYTNGITEGTNNKLKAIKRSMYGRAGRDLMTRKLALSVTG